MRAAREPRLYSRGAAEVRDGVGLADGVLRLGLGSLLGAELDFWIRRSEHPNLSTFFASVALLLCRCSWRDDRLIFSRFLNPKRQLAARDAAAAKNEGNSL